MRFLPLRLLLQHQLLFVLEVLLNFLLLVVGLTAGVQVVALHKRVMFLLHQILLIRLLLLCLDVPLLLQLRS